MNEDRWQEILRGIETPDKLNRGDSVNTQQPRKAVQKRGRSWLYRTVNSSFKVAISSVPLGVLYIVLAAIVGFFGGIGSKTFSFFFNIFGA